MIVSRQLATVVPSVLEALVSGMRSENFRLSFRVADDSSGVRHWTRGEDTDADLHSHHLGEKSWDLTLSKVRSYKLFCKLQRGMELREIAVRLSALCWRSK